MARTEAFLHIQQCDADLLGGATRLANCASLSAAGGKVFAAVACLLHQPEAPARGHRVAAGEMKSLTPAARMVLPGRSGALPDRYVLRRA